MTAKPTKPSSLNLPNSVTPVSSNKTSNAGKTLATNAGFRPRNNVSKPNSNPKRPPNSRQILKTSKTSSKPMKSSSPSQTPAYSMNSTLGTPTLSSSGIPKPSSSSPVP